MSLPCRPWFQWGYDAESELTLEYPLFPWDYGDGGVGGSDTAASGIQEAYVIRDDEIVFLRVRVTEAEMPAFKLFLRWARNSAQPFLVRLDADEPSTEQSVLLESLRWEDGARRQYERSEFPGVFIIPVALRTELGAAWGVSWSQLATEG